MKPTLKQMHQYDDNGALFILNCSVWQKLNNRKE